MIENITGFSADDTVIVGSIFKWIGVKPFNQKYAPGTAFEVTLSADRRVALTVSDDNFTFYNYPAHWLKDTACWRFSRLKVDCVEEKAESLSEIPSTGFTKTPITYKKLTRPSGGRYTEIEKLARDFEIRKEYGMAKSFFQEARSRMPGDLELDAEEKALDEGNCIAISEYNTLGKADKAAWNLKSLKPFKHYKFPFLYWE